jgi:hypothetical protein
MKGKLKRSDGKTYDIELDASELSNEPIPMMNFDVAQISKIELNTNSTIQFYLNDSMNKTNYVFDLKKSIGCSWQLAQHNKSNNSLFIYFPNRTLKFIVELNEDKIEGLTNDLKSLFTKITELL